MQAYVVELVQATTVPEMVQEVPPPGAATVAQGVHGLSAPVRHDIAEKVELNMDSQGRHQEKQGHHGHFPERPGNQQMQHFELLW